MQTNGTAIQLSAQSLAGYSFNDVMSMGDVYYQSGLFKDIRSAAQAIVKIMKGRELGIPPASAMEIINVIEGKTALSGVAIAGIIKNSRKYRYDITESTTRSATVEFFERIDGAWKSLGSASFAEEDAKRAGLAGRKNWREYPQNMMLWRALSNGGRMFCPDILAGVYTAEELGAEVNEEGATVTPLPEAKRPVEAQETLVVEEEAKAPIASQSVSTAPERPPVDETDESVPDDAPRPEWLRETAQQLREHLTQDELMELRLMWRDLRYGRDEITERMRSLAAKYGQRFAPPEVE